MKTLGVVQARMGSKRLPGKVLKRLAGRPLLKHLLERVSQAKTLDEVVVATSDNSLDDPIAEFCKREKIGCFRGPEHDVLKRYALAAIHFEAFRIVRLTADCPLLDPKVIDLVVAHFKEGMDYLSNTQDRSFPRGMDVEVFSKEALLRADREAQSPYWREHVTAYFYDHPDRFRLGRVEMRLTVDTKEDFEFMSHVIEKVDKDHSSLADIVALLQTHPEWISINGHITQ